MNVDLSSTDDDDSDERHYESIVASTLLTSSEALTPSQPLSHSNCAYMLASPHQLDAALTFLSNISLTGASPSQQRHAPRFVAVSAADFLRNISLTGPMKLPLRDHHVHHSHGHHHHHHHHQHHQHHHHQHHQHHRQHNKPAPRKSRRRLASAASLLLSVESTGLDGCDDGDRGTDRRAPESRGAGDSDDTVPAAALAANDDDDDDDPDAFVAAHAHDRFLVRSAGAGVDIIVPGNDDESLSTDADRALQAQREAEQLARFSSLRIDDPLSLSLADSAPGLASPDRLDDYYPSPLITSTIIGNEAFAANDELAIADATSAAMSNAFAALTAEEQLLQSNAELSFDLRRSDGMQMTEVDELLSAPKRKLAPRRLATSLPADAPQLQGAGSSDSVRLPLKRSAAAASVSLTPAERIAKYRNQKLSAAPSPATVSVPTPQATPASQQQQLQQQEQQQQQQQQQQQAVPAVPAKPRAKPLRVVSVSKFQEAGRGRATPQRLYLCSAGNVGSGLPPSLLSVCAFLPFVPRRRAAPTDGAQGVVGSAADVSATALATAPTGKHKKKADLTRSIAPLLQPSLLKPPPLTAGGDDQADVPPVYSATYLDDPALATGKHRVVMQLCGLTTTVLPYVRPKRLKAELNTAFARRHPWLAIKLTQLRKVKKLMLNVMSLADLELSTLALAYVYLDKLLLRKFCANKAALLLAGAGALTLATKFNDTVGMDKASYRKLIGHIRVVMGLDVREVHSTMMRAWIALDCHLFVASTEILQHLPAIRLANSSTDEKFIPQAPTTRKNRKTAPLAALSRPNTIFKVK
jgi:hypothetical protein